MKKIFYAALVSLILSLAIQNKQLVQAVTCLGGYGGGTGLCSATSSNVGQVPQVSSVSNGTPVYTYATITGGGGGSSTVITSASSPYLTFSALANGNQTGTLASVLSVGSTTDIAVSAATGTGIGFTFLNPKAFATTTIQSVLNSLSASGCLTYASSTGLFTFTCGIPATTTISLASTTFTGPAFTFAGTANQVTIATSSPNTFTLGTPQNINTTAGVQFGTLGLGNGNNGDSLETIYRAGNGAGNLIDLGNTNGGLAGALGIVNDGANNFNTYLYSNGSLLHVLIGANNATQIDVSTTSVKIVNNNLVDASGNKYSTSTAAGSGFTNANASSGISISTTTSLISIQNTGVLSVNGGTGAISNIAVTNADNNFSSQTVKGNVTTTNATVSSTLQFYQAQNGSTSNYSFTNDVNDELRIQNHGGTQGGGTDQYSLFSADAPLAPGNCNAIGDPNANSQEATLSDFRNLGTSTGYQYTDWTQQCYPGGSHPSVATLIRQSTVAAGASGGLMIPFEFQYAYATSSANILGSVADWMYVKPVTATNTAAGFQVGINTTTIPVGVTLNVAGAFQQSSITNALGLLDGNGKLIAYTGSDCGSQFVQAVSATGTAKCATPAGSGSGNVTVTTAANTLAGNVLTWNTNASTTVNPTSTLFCNTTGCAIGSSTVPQSLFLYSGTTAPFLRIQGSSDGSSFSGMEFWDNIAAPNTDKWQIVQSAQDGPNNFEIIQNTGNRGFKFPLAITSSTDFVGVNTKTPATQLDVNGDITDRNVTSAPVSTDSTGKLIKATITTSTLAYSALLDSTTTPILVSNTTTITTFYSYTLAGNALGLGKTLRIEASGVFQDAGPANSNLRCFLLYGGATIVGGTITAVPSSTANAYWDCRFLLNNASGTTNNQIGTVMMNTTAGNLTNSAPAGGVGSSTIDSTANQTVALQIAMNQKNASDTVTATNVTTMLDGATTTIVTNVQ